MPQRLTGVRFSPSITRRDRILDHLLCPRSATAPGALNNVSHLTLRTTQYHRVLILHLKMTNWDSKRCNSILKISQVHDLINHLQADNLILTSVPTHPHPNPKSTLGWEEGTDNASPLHISLKADEFYKYSIHQVIINILPSITSPRFLEETGKRGIFSENIDIHLGYSSPSPFEQHINYWLCCQMLHVIVFSITSQGKRKVIGSAMGRDMRGALEWKLKDGIHPLGPPPRHPTSPGAWEPRLVSSHKQESRRLEGAEYDESEKLQERNSELFMCRSMPIQTSKNISTYFSMAKRQVLSMSILVNQ